MNELFYPKTGHSIEAEYIRPLAKSPADFKRPCGPATKEAFSCSRSEEELSRFGHIGALNWIRRFKTPENIAKLGTNELFWYQMTADTLTDLVMFINYGERLFVGRVAPPAFVDQRLVALEPRGPVDIALSHALLNSTVSLFIIEGMGFGRGLGALDLSKNRIEAYMQILDPGVLDQTGVDRIKAAFAPLLQRDVLNIADELEQEDRKAFDETVIEAFGLNVERQHIYDSLLSLVGIRLAAVD